MLQKEYIKSFSCMEIFFLAGTAAVSTPVLAFRFNKLQRSVVALI